MDSKLMNLIKQGDESTIMDHKSNLDPMVREMIAVYGSPAVRKYMINQREQDLFVLRSLVEHGDDNDRVKILQDHSDQEIVLEAARMYGGGVVQQWIDTYVDSVVV